MTSYHAEVASVQLMTKTMTFASPFAWTQAVTGNVNRIGVAFSVNLGSGITYTAIPSYSNPNPGTLTTPNAGFNQPLVFHRNLHGQWPSMPWWVYVGTNGTALVVTEMILVNQQLDQQQQAVSEQPQIQQPSFGLGVPSLQPYIDQLQAMLQQLKTAQGQ
jgi:hypothetical protein